MLVVVINKVKIIEYDRSKRLTGVQRRFLDEMDTQMADGINLGDEFIAKPTVLQRCQYVANTLVNAVLAEKDPLAAATCSYLATRLPNLQQVRARSSENGASIELVFDRSYEQSAAEQPVNFVPRPEDPSN
ncbi:MAG: hypothetical protein ACWA44_06585 [Thiotrichales bacterium]